MARKTFFSFHYNADVWRAWNVRNCLSLADGDDGIGFYDRSVFEASKRESDASLKAFLRDGMKNTSVTCVLSGTNTWSRRWVRYEIARAILKGNGLLTVDIHGVKDNSGNISAKGEDPLAYLALYRDGRDIFFAEWKEGKWVKYSDYTLAIAEADLWFAAPKAGIVQLSTHCLRYDFSGQNGRANIGQWIETAAALAGR